MSMSGAHCTRAHGYDQPFRGLLLGGVRNDDAALGFALGINSLDEDAITQRANA
jgi:hypothetical protein